MESGRDQRSPLRRCFKPRPLRRAECAGFASSCRSDVLKSSHSPGGWPASCPATYRSTHGHRHVRNWARIEIIHLTRESTLFTSRALREHKKICASVKKFFAHGESQRASALATRGSGLGGEGLDAARVENKAHHHGDAAEEEDALQRVDTVAA